MKENRTLYRVDIGTEQFTALTPCSSADLQVKEKQIETWMATQTKLLFSDPNAVMVISQEITGELMADLLAVDSQGNLIIIEIKRGASDRGTIGQLLDYGARLAAWTYEDFNYRWQNYTGKSDDLFTAFTGFVENPSFDRREFLKNRRLYILASSDDESMRRVIAWLRDDYGVPIDFVPFQFYEDQGQIFLEIARIEIEPIILPRAASGDWFFNTNETYGEGAYVAMLRDGVIAVWGKERGQELLDRPAPGDRVIAYVNRHGVVAIGRVGEEEARPGNTVFGKENDREMHRKVRWEITVDPSKALSAADISEMGYNLPVRSALGQIYHPTIVDKISKRLQGEG